jgi:tRNA pseudouridine38-40 synthase
MNVGSISRMALGVEYDGTDFSGWQSQLALRTVQPVLEQAVALFLASEQRVPVVAAGRTDAGVHAYGQVIHLDSPVEREPSAWVRGVNAYLPADVAVRWAHRVADDFHARFSALRRSYRYTIYNHPVRSPLHLRQSAWCFRSLDIDAMQLAAQAWLGTHDFSSFRSSECQAKTAVRTLTRLDIEQSDRFIYLDFEANAFLHHMVRNMVGTLVYVGMKRKPPGWAAEVLAARDRRLAAPTYAACGLCLTRVLYPNHFEIPAQ